MRGELSCAQGRDGPEIPGGPSTSRKTERGLAHARGVCLSLLIGWKSGSGCNCSAQVSGSFFGSFSWTCNSPWVVLLPSHILIAGRGFVWLSSHSLRSGSLTPSARSARKGLSSTAIVCDAQELSPLCPPTAAQHGSPCSEGCCRGAAARKLSSSLSGILKALWFTVTGIALAGGASKLIWQLLLGSSRVVTLTCSVRQKWRWLEDCHRLVGTRRWDGRPVPPAHWRASSHGAAGVSVLHSTNVKSTTVEVLRQQKYFLEFPFSSSL